MYDLSLLHQLLQKELPCPAIFSGRGIVTCAGGLFLPSVYVLIRSLRHHGCTLPIQVWHLGPRELPQPVRPVFEAQGAVFVDCFEIMKIHPYRRIGGWESKPFALSFSPFEETLFLDADNFALRNPEFLFRDPAYLEKGSILWPDFEAGPNDFWAIKPAAWKLLELPPMQGAEIESGQILVNKKRCWRSLVVTMHMNEYSDFYYANCTHGDKDTFLLSWKLTHNDAFLVPRRPKAITAPVRIQFGPDDKPLFQHSRKWILPPSGNNSIADYEQEREALEWLAEFQAVVPQSAAWFLKTAQTGR